MKSFRDIVTEAKEPEYWTITFNWDNKSYYFNVFIATTTGRYQVHADEWDKFDSKVPEYVRTTKSGKPMKEFFGTKAQWKKVLEQRGSEYVKFSKGKSA